MAREPDGASRVLGARLDDDEREAVQRAGDLRQIPLDDRGRLEEGGGVVEL